MNNMQHYLRFIPFMAFSICMLWFLVKKWKFIESALSDKGNGSATRTSGFILVLVVAFNEVFTTIKSGKFELIHLQYLLVAILTFFGFIKIMDAFSIWKGGNKSTTLTETKEIKSETNN